MKEAIILAGGLGTRLKEKVPDLPKCMAPVNGKPFLSFVIDSMRMHGVQRFIFSLGYKWEIIDQYLKVNYPTLQYISVIEKEPLGTGGAIKLALQSALNKDVFIANGDTLFKANLNEVQDLHLKQDAHCTVALKPMENFDRYGVVEIDKNNRIISFKEKKQYRQGLINGGIYLLNKSKFQRQTFPSEFSFEKDYLEANYNSHAFFGSVQEGYFIDIGIPEDYFRAQEDLMMTPLDLKKINRDWTLFLDRDGVINEEKKDEYVLNPSQFIFSEGVLEALKILRSKFGRILIISNQRGVGKELMTEKDLKDIHTFMMEEISNAGGHIDKIFYCTDKDDACFDRKPNPGMALQALKDYPDIDFSKTIMVGNKPSDMRFGRSIGAFTIFLPTTNPEQSYPHPDIDLQFHSLLDFARSVKS